LTYRGEDALIRRGRVGRNKLCGRTVQHNIGRLPNHRGLREEKKKRRRKNIPCVLLRKKQPGKRQGLKRVDTANVLLTKQEDDGKKET